LGIRGAIGVHEAGAVGEGLAERGQIGANLRRDVEGLLTRLDLAEGGWIPIALIADIQARAHGGVLERRVRQARTVTLERAVHPKGTPDFAMGLGVFFRTA
jgi:hypothetical protein